MDIRELPRLNKFVFQPTSCPICEHDKSETHHVITRFEQGNLKFVRCHNCGTVYQNPRPDATSMHAFYESQNFFRGSEGKNQFVGYVDYDADEQIRLKNAYYRLKEVEQMFSAGRKLNILKIACGYGTFVKVANDAGHYAQGIDFSNVMVDGARQRYGIELIAANFLEHDFGDETFDCILLYGAINNFVDILALGRKVSELLAPGGIYLSNFIETGSLIERIQKSHFWLYRPPIIGIWSAANFINAHTPFGLQLHKLFSDVQWVTIGRLAGYLQSWRLLKLLSWAGLHNVFLRIPTPGYVKVALRRKPN